MIRNFVIRILEYLIRNHFERVQKVFNYIHPRVIDETAYLKQIKANTNVSVIIDVGVHEGTPNLYSVFKDKHFILVDPVIDQLEFKPQSYKFIQKGLGEKNEIKKFNIHPNSGLSSYKEELNLNRNIESSVAKVIETEVITLDNLISNECSKDHKIGIKIDTQGSEYDILLGLEKFIDRVEFIILENNILPRYDNSKLFSETTSLLFKKDFYFLNILEPSYAIPRYNYDCVYLHKRNPLFKTKK